MDGTDPRIDAAARFLDRYRERDQTEPAPQFWERQFPLDPTVRVALAEGFDLVGIAAFNAGEIERAKEAFFPLVLLRLAIVRDNRSDRTAIRDFASAEDLLSLTLIETGQLADAAQLLGEALGYREKLARDQPDDAQSAYLYGVALAHMGRLEAAKQDRVAARGWLIRAQEHLKDVVGRWPSIAIIAGELVDVTQRLDRLGAS